jgi:hypothetical protein
MSMKTRVLGAAVSLTLVGGLTTVGTVPATAATPQCGSHCIEVFSPRFGTPAQPDFVETVRHRVARVGQPAILYRASDSNPAEDWIVPAGGLVAVSQLYAEGLVSAAVERHYRSLDAAQIEYAPHGKATGLCTGVAMTAFENEGLTLQPCSVPDDTIWIIDTAVAPPTEAGYFALINGSTTDFSRPYVMTYRHDPPAQIRAEHLRLSKDGTASDTQLFGADFGVLG